MMPGQNRSAYVFLGFCFLFLVTVIILIIFINRPSSEETAAIPSPTPVSSSGRTNPNNRNPSIPPVEGESDMTDEEVQQFQQSQRQAAAAYQARLRRMPFITKLPYSNTHFKIEITAVSDTVYISTFGPPSFQARYRQEALDWIRQNGGNPDALTIQYKN